MPIRFVIVCPRRTGSILLLSLLSSHPDIFSYEEALSVDVGTLRALNDFDALRAYQIMEASEGCVGFKLLYHHFFDSSNRPALDQLSVRKDIKVIHLSRRNLLHQLVSFERCMITNEWISAGQADNRLVKMRFSPDYCNYWWEKVQYEEKRIRDFFSRHASFSIVYEDIFDTIDKILDFLELPQAQLTSWVKKQNQYRMDEIVENYTELKDAFVGSKWSSFFQE